jgi:phospho-N-acetylmuramoyl-pentapeptide-transferase
MEISALAKVFSLTVLGAAVAAAATPALTSLLYRLRMGKQIRDDGTTPVFSKLHAHKAGTPTMGGILMWGTVAFLAIGFWVVQHLFGTEWAANLAFLNRRETLLPLGALLGASLVGLLDDFLDVRRLGHKGRGIRFRHKFFLYLAVAAVGAWWFYSKLGFSQVHVPFYGDLELGLWYVPFFIAVVIGTSFSINETDGLDGLAGGQ